MCFESDSEATAACSVRQARFFKKKLKLSTRNFSNFRHDRKGFITLLLKFKQTDCDGSSLNQSMVDSVEKDTEKMINNSLQGYHKNERPLFCDAKSQFDDTD